MVAFTLFVPKYKYKSIENTKIYTIYRKSAKEYRDNFLLILPSPRL